MSNSNNVTPPTHDIPNMYQPGYKAAPRPSILSSRAYLAHHPNGYPAEAEQPRVVNPIGLGSPLRILFPGHSCRPAAAAMTDDPSTPQGNRWDPDSDAPDRRNQSRVKCDDRYHGEGSGHCGNPIKRSTPVARVVLLRSNLVGYTTESRAPPVVHRGNPGTGTW
jgi:hypothetical protein